MIATVPEIAMSMSVWWVRCPCILPNSCPSGRPHLHVSSILFVGLILVSFASSRFLIDAKPTVRIIIFFSHTCAYLSRITFSILHSPRAAEASCRPSGHSCRRGRGAADEIWTAVTPGRHVWNQENARKHSGQDLKNMMNDVKLRRSSNVYVNWYS